MALSSEEQKLYDLARDVLPAWFRDDEEFLHGCAKMFGSVRAMQDYFSGQTLIGSAVGATATTPDWLAQHARDRATGRRISESDPTLRERIRNVPDSLTRSSILAAANAILAASGTAGSVVMVELPRDGAHSGTYASMIGVGGTFSAPVATVQTFTPDVAFEAPPVNSGGYPWVPWKITTTGAANAGNNVAAAAITGVVGDGATYVNAAGVAATDATVVWTAEKVIHAPYVADGFARSYSQRGYRSARARPLAIVLIVPYPATAATAASILEMLRQKKAAGIIGLVERRTTP